LHIIYKSTGRGHKVFWSSHIQGSRQTVWRHYALPRRREQITN